MLQPTRPFLRWLAPLACDHAGVGARPCGGLVEMTMSEIRTARVPAVAGLRAGLGKNLSRMTRLFARSPGRSEVRLH